MELKEVKEFIYIISCKSNDNKIVCNVEVHTSKSNLEKLEKIYFPIPDYSSGSIGFENIESRNKGLINYTSNVVFS